MNFGGNIHVACLLYNLEPEETHLGQDDWNHLGYDAVFIDKHIGILEETAASNYSLGITGLRSSWMYYEHSYKAPQKCQLITILIVL